jgi:UDP-glucose 4-epimerase
MKNILITGGAGFVGFHLASKLIGEGNKVSILDNFARPNEDEEFSNLQKNKNLTFIQKDAALESTWLDLPIDKFDIIYHLAALNGTANFYNHPAKVIKTGTLSTIYLLDYVSRHESKPKVIYTSSSEAYAGTAKLLEKDFPIPTPEDIPLTIDDVKNVRWSYGASKLIGEVAFYCYSKTYDIKDFNIIRLHNIYGPRMGFEHVISQFIKRFIEGETPFNIYGADCTRSFCHISDVLDAFDKITHYGEPGEIYHIGNDDEEISIHKLAEELFDLNNREHNFTIHDSPEGSVNRRCPNIDKLKSLGHTKKMELTEGLKQTYEWYYERLKK